MSNMRVKNGSNYFFIVTIDVEADNVWKTPTNLSVNNLAKIPVFQRLCKKYGIVPTYLLSYETLADNKFVSFLKEIESLKECEVGIHPHVWTIPPYIKEKDSVDIAIVRYYQSMLDENILIKKLETLHKEIQNKIGVRPTAHRAGRWGLCLRSIKWLEKNGYIADTSVVPFKSFKDSTLDSTIYPDYYNAVQYPYRMSNQNILKKGNLGLVEVPTTNINCFVYPEIVKISDWMKMKRGGFRFNKLLRKLSMYPNELRPYPQYLQGTLTKIAKIVIKKNYPIINLMFHSSELIAGGSPYSKDERNTTRIWDHIEELFSFIHLNGITSLGISSAVKELKKNNYFSE